MKPRRSLAWIALVATAALVTVRLLTPHEPKFEGKPLSAWVMMLHPSGRGYDPKDFEEQSRIHERGVEAVRAIGTNALPFLLQEVLVRDRPLKRAFMRLVERQSFIGFRWASAEDRRLRAVSGFEALRPVGVSAVPALLDLFAGDPDVAFCASVRDNSALSLGRFGPQAGVAAPALRTMIQDKRDPMGDAACALVRVDPEAAAEAGVR